MPTIRYKIRNEYGLADAELYQTARKDDPEAILEGVSMAGLVGMLRQLGDLAEFAAEIFCDLHEEVMGIAARGHGLMLRVQQIEAEFSTVENSLLSQNHSKFAYNDGIEWHSNIQMQQNLITQVNMPRFMLNSYEECCGPPRLFTLDKFDIAGAGACLKRYSDPSFFKMEQISSSLMETNIPREIKIQKIKMKGSRWRNGQKLESLLSTLADPNLQKTNSDKVLDKSAEHLGRLKSRNLNDTNGSGVGLRKIFFALHSDEQKVVYDHSRVHSNFNAISIDSSEFSSKIHCTGIDIPENHPLSRNGSHNMIPSEVVTTLRTDQMDNWKERDEILPDEQLESIYVVQNPKRTLNYVKRMDNSADSGNKQEGRAYDYELRAPTGTTSVQVLDHYVIEDELKLDGNSTDGYRTEDFASELENSMDVLNSLESEVETDPDNNGEPYLNMPREEVHEMDDNDYNEVLEKLQTETSELYSAEVSTRAGRLDNILESGMLSFLFCDTVIEPGVLLATQDKGVSDSYLNSNLILGGPYDEKDEKLLPHDEVANSADLISAGASNLRAFKMRTDNKEESCSPNVINSSLNNLQPQESSHIHQLVTSNQDETSAGHLAQLGTDNIARCFNGSSHSNSNFPAERIVAEHVNEMVLEDMTGTHQMLNVHSFSPTESFSVDPDKAHLLIMAVPAGKEKQNSVVQDAKSFASEDVKAGTSGNNSLTSIIASVPVNSLDVPQVDRFAAEMDHGQHTQELTSETSANFTKKTNGVDQNMNDSTLGTKDSNVSDSSHIASNAAVLVSEEESCIAQLVDRLSYTEQNNSQDFGVNSTETILHPVPFATISGKECIKKKENTESVDKLSKLISDTQESQESLKTNLTVQSDEFLNLKITVEPQESSKVYIADLSQKSCKVITIERMSSSCSTSDAYISKVTKPPMHVLDSLKFCAEANQDNLKKNVEVINQIIHVKTLSTEYSSPCHEIYNHDPSLVYCQEAYDLQSVVDSTEFLLPSAPSVVAACDKDCMMELKNMDEVESLFSLESSDDFENAQMTKADRETPKTVQLTSEYFSDTQDWQESFKVISDEESQESNWLNSAEGSYEFPNLNLLEESQESLKLNTTEESQESSGIQASEWVTSPCSGSGTCSARVAGSTMLVLDYLKFSTDINQNPQRNIENVNEIIHDKNLSPENFENSGSGSETYNHDTSLGNNQEAIQSKLQGDSTDFSAASCEVVVLTHERDCPNNLEVLDARTYMDKSVSSELNKPPLVFDASCSGLLGEIDDDIPVVHVEAYAHTSVTETANQDLPLSTNMFVDTATSRKDASTLDSIIPESSHQKAEDFVLGVPTNSDNIDKLSEGPDLNNHNITNNTKYNEVDMLQSDERPGMEVYVLLKRSSELSSFHFTSDALDVIVPHVPKSDVPLTESAIRPSSESLLDDLASNCASQNPEESPPLPPLEWMTRKIQLSSPLPREDPSKSLAGTNPFTEPLYDKPANQNVAPPFTLSVLVPTIVGQSHQHDPVFLERKIVNSPNAPLLLSSSLEYENRGSKSPVLDSFTPAVLENQITEDTTFLESVQPMLNKSFRFTQSDSGLELEESHNYEGIQQKFEEEFVQSQNPYFIGSSLEDVSNQSTCRNFGGENVHLLKSTERSISSRHMPHQPGYIFSLNRSQNNLLGVLPPMEDEWFSIRPRSIRNLPRNPLMEAVAAHDRSTLRKVSKLARSSSEPKADKSGAMLESYKLQLRKISEVFKPSIEPKAVEKDAWIEQIRSKSFSLKPAVHVMPNIKGYPTNIKVAAILEKATALRQAVAGSDEEDGGDSWSDC